MTRTRLALLGLLTGFAGLLSNCVQVPPPPPPPMRHHHEMSQKSEAAKPAETQQNGRLVEGRFIRDTPPDKVEPAKTIRVEKDF